jgi:hypothetical protein
MPVLVQVQAAQFRQTAQMVDRVAQVLAPPQWEYQAQQLPAQEINMVATALPDTTSPPPQDCRLAVLLPLVAQALVGRAQAADQRKQEQDMAQAAAVAELRSQTKVDNKTVLGRQPADAVALCLFGGATNYAISID